MFSVLVLALLLTLVLLGELLILNLLVVGVCELGFGLVDRRLDVFFESVEDEEDVFDWCGIDCCCRSWNRGKSFSSSILTCITLLLP